MYIVSMYFVYIRREREVEKVREDQREREKERKRRVSQKGREIDRRKERVNQEKYPRCLKSGGPIEGRKKKQVNLDVDNGNATHVKIIW